LGGANGDYGNSIVQTSDDGLAMTGNTASYGAGVVDMFLFKYDSNGTLVWNKTWGGTAADVGYSIVQTSDNCLAVAGYTASYGAGSADMFLAKYNSSGIINNCSSPMCQSPSATVTSPSATSTVVVSP